MLNIINIFALGLLQVMFSDPLGLCSLIVCVILLFFTWRYVTHKSYCNNCYLVAWMLKVFTPRVITTRSILANYSCPYMYSICAFLWLTGHFGRMIYREDCNHISYANLNLYILWYKLRNAASFFPDPRIPVVSLIGRLPHRYFCDVWAAGTTVITCTG